MKNEKWGRIHLFHLSFTIAPSKPVNTTNKNWIGGINNYNFSNCICYFRCKCKHSNKVKKKLPKNYCNSRSQYSGRNHINGELAASVEIHLSYRTLMQLLLLESQQTANPSILLLFSISFTKLFKL